jgi:hypothetical protein
VSRFVWYKVGWWGACLIVYSGYCWLPDVHLGDQRFGNVWAEHSNIWYVWFEYVRFYHRRFHYIHLLCTSAYVSIR